MPSQAAKVRALERGPGFWGFLVAHHYREQLDRCYRVWWLGRPVWFCSRCLGLYPSLLLVLGLLLAVPVPSGWWDFVWLFGLPLPALIDWVWSGWTGRPGRNGVRTLTGVLLGISLGRTVYVNMVSPAHWMVLTQLGLFVLLVLIVEVARRIRFARGTVAGERTR